LGVALLLATAFAAIGRVFVTTPGVADAATIANLLGATSAYGGHVRLNGERARLDVLGSERSLPDIVRELERSFGSDVTRVQVDGHLARLDIRAGDDVVRVLAADLPAHDRCALFLLRQSRAAFERSRTAPPDSRLDGLPALPRATPQLLVADESKSFELLVATTRSHPDAASAEAEDALLQAGWRRALQTSPDRARPPGPALYMKGFDVCAVSAARADRAAETTITVLHRRPSVK
jgi:hypothetical protein